MRTGRCTEKMVMRKAAEVAADKAAELLAASKRHRTMAADIAAALSEVVSNAHALPETALPDVAVAGQPTLPDSLSCLPAASPASPAASITDGSRKRGRSDMEMIAVPTDRLRTLGQRILQVTGTAHSMVNHCVSFGLHMQTEAELFESSREEIEAFIPGV